MQRAVAGADFELVRRRDRRAHIGLGVAHRFDELIALGEACGDGGGEGATGAMGVAGFKPRREGNRIYFPDVDGIEVQVSGS